MGERHRTGGKEFLYGRNAVIEAVRAGRRRLRQLFVAEGAERQPRIAGLVADARRVGLPIVRVRPAELDRMLGEVNHQGVALEAGPYPYEDLADMLREAGGRPLVFLDHVQDPQNLGTLMRTAEATQAAGLVIPEHRAARITPAVVNASAGAVEHLSVAMVINLSRAAEVCKEAGYWIVALEADPGSEVIYQAAIPEPTVLVVGSEGKGVSPGLLKHCDLMVRLPMLGRVESLNAAVAGSIALYELLRRRLGPD